MKKDFYPGILKCLVIMFLAIAVVSCGDDDDHTVKVPDPDPVPVTADVVYKIGDMYDAFSLLDVKVTYMNGEGKEVTETVEAASWQKSIHVNTLPFTAKIVVSYAKKENFTLTEDKYRLGRGIGISYQTSQNKFGDSSVFSFNEVPKDKVEPFLDKFYVTKKDSVRIE